MFTLEEYNTAGLTALWASAATPEWITLEVPPDCFHSESPACAAEDNLYAIAGIINNDHILIEEAATP